MSYWGSTPGAHAAAPPSPMVPLLLVVTLGWVIYSETLMAWYEQVVEVQEAVTDNAVALALAIGFLLVMVLVSNRGEVVLVPAALVLVMFLIKNIMVAALLLLLVVYFVGIYYYPPDRGYVGGERGGAGLGLYMLLLLCLVLCAMFSEEGGSWWVSCVLLAACILCFNLFSGGKILGSEYF